MHRASWALLPRGLGSSILGLLFAGGMTRNARFPIVGHGIAAVCPSFAVTMQSFVEKPSRFFTKLTHSEAGYTTSLAFGPVRRQPSGMFHANTVYLQAS